ncbi:FAD-dependent oxidoreductase [Tritonibacter mobilis]|uniref:FAD-dependent oxidoreductase n=1 Tax=Tritonibacter mobilis TaxID=379347 RepID=UPI0008068AC5|nr:FAD-dependent oxidoreductase [Tritonibacter mobilis]
MKILIVGAGFSGAVYARECAEAGHQVSIIDQRNHIAGNAYDHTVEGVRIHKYGPHLFHTSNERVVEWLSQFTEWVNYSHKVRALMEDGRLVPFPVNRETVQQVIGTTIDALPIDPQIATSAEDAHTYLISQIGDELTELFFQRYTQKMWGMSLSEMSADVVRRVKIRTDCEDRYFPNDRFQAMPKDGYTAIFEKIFDHLNISVQLGVPFDKSMEAEYDYVFNSMAIDEYFDYVHGRLPYRSIRFHHHISDDDQSRGQVTINYTDTAPFTRETHWHNIPQHRVHLGRYIRTVEEPCSYEDNNFERYYPVKTSDNRYAAIYKKYQEQAIGISDRLEFIGRCGTYQYLDMHQVIMQSLHGVRKWLASRTTS